MIEPNRHHRSILHGWTALIVFLVVASGCHKDELEYLTDGTVRQQQLPDGAITISPLDQALDMAVWGSDSTTELAPVINVSVTSPEADFVMPIGTQHLYVEQNDDRQWRTATVSVTRADGTQQRLTLAQPPATRATEQDIHRSFLRHHAVGYSYDAVGGEYCNLNYVRCQLLNRAVIDDIERTNSFSLINVERISEMRIKHEVYKSFVDYVQNSNFSANAKGQILLAFNAEVDAKLHVFEEGNIETYILHDERVLPKARYTLLIDNITELIKDYPNLLTSSFRKALRQLAAKPVNDWRSVDEFLETYGTHMVIDAELGARLDLDVQIETHKFNQLRGDSLLADASLAKLIEVHFSQNRQDVVYEEMRNCKCKLDIIGGDMSILDDVIGTTTFASKDINISDEELDRWMLSVYFDDNDLINSNVELTNMRVVPIWELVEDETLKERIMARVYSNAAAMQKLLGNRNFINVTIPYSTRKYVCRVGDRKYTFTDPDVTDVIVAGRHVATICLEPVPDITEKEKVRVIYPIYEGHVKLSKGLCVYNGKSYTVDWSENRLVVEELGAIASNYDGNIYLNYGNLSTSPTPYADYTTGHLVAGLERPGGIGIDGSLKGTPVRVVKYFNHFYLKDKNNYDNLPNWTYVTTLPDEAYRYPEYFDNNTWKDRMRRDDGYLYIYNTTEIGYE